MSLLLSTTALVLLFFSWRTDAGCLDPACARRNHKFHLMAAASTCLAVSAVIAVASSTATWPIVHAVVLVGALAAFTGVIVFEVQRLRAAARLDRADRTRDDPAERVGAEAVPSQDVLTAWRCDHR